MVYMAYHVVCGTVNRLIIYVRISKCQKQNITILGNKNDNGKKIKVS